jgi:hypothetical protein
MTQHATAIAPGQVVEFRRRLWRVNEIGGDEFMAVPIDGTLADTQRFLTHLERPAPAGVPPPDYATLGSALFQDLLLRAYRLSMIHGSAPFLSLQRSSVIPMNYQLVPLVMALQQPRVRLLIGDDVGLGKTIEAGLILSEMLARGRVRKVVIITPANLREQWRQTLSYLFHIDAVILSSQNARLWQKELPAGASPWQYFDRLIVSIDYAKTVEHHIQLLDALTPQSMVIVDEAHIAARPHQAGRTQKVDMDRWQLVQQVAAKAPHLILMSATPHNGYTDSFASLIRMVEPDAVQGSEATPAIIRPRARRYVCQRARKNIETWLTGQGMKSPFPKRDQPSEQPLIPLNPAFSKVLNLVEEYAVKIVEYAGGRGNAGIVARWLALHFQRRALSSPAALRNSLESRLAEIERRLGEPADTAAPSPDEGAIESSLFDRDPGESMTDEEAVRRTDLALILEKHYLIKEREPLEKALAAARKIKPVQDAKFQNLAKTVLPELFRHDGRVIVFTRYYDTLAYLADNLPSALGSSVSVLTMHGDMSEAQRRETFARFERTAKCVLVATDVISEGLNLQHACSQIVHHELPWNPNRLEQRNGRVDRFGQPKPTVYVRTLVMDHWLDMAILELLINKADRIRKERGFAPPFWGDEENILHLLRTRGYALKKAADMQGTFFSQLFCGPPADQDTDTEDPLSDEVVERVAQDSFYGEVEISLPDVQTRLERSRKLIGSPQQIESFVRQALSHFHCIIREERDKSLTILMPEPRLQLPGIGNELRKATFSPEMALADPDLNVLDIGHPLVRRLVEIVKEDFFRAGAQSGRAVSIVTPGCKEVTVLYRFLARFAAQNHGSVLEELVDAAFPVYGDRAYTIEEIERLLAMPPAARLAKPAECQPHFDAAWGSTVREKAVKDAVERRRQELVRERTELRERIKKDSKAADTAWLDGADQIKLISLDLLTATLHLPR